MKLEKQVNKYTDMETCSSVSRKYQRQGSIVVLQYISIFLNETDWCDLSI